VFVGDIILAVDGQPLYGQQGFAALLEQKIGHTVERTIARGALTITKSVTLAE
jgi:S1-C subfamily serine protease